MTVYPYRCPCVQLSVEILSYSFWLGTEGVPYEVYGRLVIRATMVIPILDSILLPVAVWSMIQA